MVSVGILNYTITLSCLVGLGLSIYGYIVELSLELDDKYQPMCDISEHMSCTKAFKSAYGKGMGIVGPLLGEDSFLNKPNCLLGILFYSLMATLTQTNSKFITKVALVYNFVALCSSVYFAYILYFILYDFCVVCVATYVVNIVNLLLTHIKLKKISTVEKKDKMKKKN